MAYDLCRCGCPVSTHVVVSEWQHHATHVVIDPCQACRMCGYFESALLP